MSYEIKQIENRSDWDKILLRCPHSNAFQTAIWRDALANAFSQLVPKFRLIYENDQPIGCLPIFIFQPIPGIKMLQSMPWNLFGGIQLIENVEIDLPKLANVIENELSEIVKSEGICETVFHFFPDQIENYDRILKSLGYEKQADRFTHILKTDRDHSEIWTAYNKRVRGAVRKSIKSGVQVSDATTQNDLSAFYEIYLKTQQRLDGTPKPIGLIRELFESEIGNLAIAKRKSEIIAGLLYLTFNKTVTLWCAGSDTRFWEFRPNNAIFDHIIRRACGSDQTQVDFGASPSDNHGLIAHKEQYRAERVDFVSYAKIHSPIKKAMWDRSEPTLRKVYTWMQNL